MKIKYILITAVMSAAIFYSGSAAAEQTLTISQLQAQIQAIMQQLQTMQTQQTA